MSKFETEMDFIRAGELSRIHIAIDEFNNLTPAEQVGIFDRLYESDENIRRIFKIFKSIQNIFLADDVCRTFLEFVGELAFPGYLFNTSKHTDGFASVALIGNLPSYYTYDFANSNLPKMMEVKSVLKAIFNKPDKKTLNRMKLFFVAALADHKKNNGHWIMVKKEDKSVTFIS